MTKLKILLIDIETAPSLGYAWGKYDQTILKFEKYRYMLSFSAKWLGTNTHIVKGLPDYPVYDLDKENDSQLVNELRELLDEADIVIGHNCDKFDIKVINTRCAVNNILPPAPFRTIDTLKLSKKYFGAESYRLNDLGIFLGVGHKVHTGGFSLWYDCMNGDKQAWARMKKYNKQDVSLLEKVYLKLRPWSGPTHPRVSVEDEDQKCVVCGSSNVQKRGYNYTKMYKFQRFACLKCGAWTQGTTEKKRINV